MAGLLDRIVGALPGHAAAQGDAGMPQIIGNLLADRQIGGLGGLVERFAAAGLGHVVQSWIGAEPNQPVSPEQLHAALGEEKAQDMAAQAGMPVDQLMGQLSRFLPQVIDRLTPNGEVPEHLKDPAKISV